MKRFIAIIVALATVFTLTSCGGGTNSSANTSNTVAPDSQQNTIENTTNNEQDTASTPKAEDDSIDDEAWDELNAVGKVQIENGILTTTITMPGDLIGGPVTQESLDAGAGEQYISAKLNDDGSVSYKMTKKQHKTLLDGIYQGVEQSLADMVQGNDYSFTEIKHNKNYTQFDVTIKGDELTLSDSFATMAFYMYGGFYGIFSGKGTEKVIVNFYNSKGELIETADSSKTES